MWGFVLILCFESVLSVDVNAMCLRSCFELFASKPLSLSLSLFSLLSTIHR